MCRWMGSHFHNWVNFSRVTRMGSHIFGISGIGSGKQGFKNRKIRG